MKKSDFADRINPDKLGFSPKMTAIVGAIIGHDYGVRDHKGGRLHDLYITSDGFVMSGSTAHASGALVGTADDLWRNLKVVKSAISEEDRKEFERLYKLNVKDWRTT